MGHFRFTTKCGHHGYIQTNEGNEWTWQCQGPKVTEEDGIHEGVSGGNRLYIRIAIARYLDIPTRSIEIKRDINPPLRTTDKGATGENGKANQDTAGEEDQLIAKASGDEQQQPITQPPTNEGNQAAGQADNDEEKQPAFQATNDEEEQLLTQPPNNEKEQVTTQSPNDKEESEVSRDPLKGTENTDTAGSPSKDQSDQPTESETVASSDETESNRHPGSIRRKMQVEGELSTPKKQKTSYVSPRKAKATPRQAMTTPRKTKSTPRKPMTTPRKASTVNSKYKLEFSPNKRARCRGCKDKILEGELRVGMKCPFGSGPNKLTHDEFYHANCCPSKPKKKILGKKEKEEVSNKENGSDDSVECWKQQVEDLDEEERRRKEIIEVERAELRKRLLRLRDRLHEKQGGAGGSTVIILNTVIDNIVFSAPTTERALLNVKGVGKKILGTYGKAILKEVRKFIHEEDYCNVLPSQKYQQYEL